MLNKMAITSTTTMIGQRLLGLALVLLGVCSPAFAASAIHKCMINGTTTFQKDPCPSSGARKDPSVDRLNVEEKKRREASGLDGTGRTRSPALSASSSAGLGATAAPPPNPTFRCDGRTVCSQMTSCSEAKYFLAHCPGVKMDGDKNGIPCEQQWCGR